jgi:hypothetical protein
VAAVTLSRTARAVLAGLLALTLGWLIAPHWAPPVYDGLGFPDEPYRFVVRPDGAGTAKSPTTAKTVVPVTKWTAGAASLASAEQAPQVAILIPTGRLQAPTGTKQFTVQAAPITPISAPSGTYLWSNVYAVGATDASVTLKDGNPPATITLRAGTAQRPQPTIEYYAHGTWTAVTTIAVGRDIYQASLPSLGDYAVVGSKPLVVGAQANSGTTSRTGVIILVGAIVVVIGLVTVGVLRRRQRTSEDPE